MTSDVPGRVAEIHASVGAKVEAGAELLVLESMKMLMPIAAPQDGVVDEVAVEVDQFIQEGELLVRLRIA